VKKSLTPVARSLRNDPTEAEKHLWHLLRCRQFGFKFRRQAVIGQYIVDFVCYEKKLVIEADGGQHSQNQKDILRDEWLRRQGFTVLRFWNNDVLGNLEGVYQKIEEVLKTPSQSLPTRGRAPHASSTR
jgi:very-short-patch-repair endonuclease